MTKLRTFKRESDGETMVYPPFVAHPHGYDLIIWDDMTDKQAKRTEEAAYDAANKLWVEAHGIMAQRSEIRFEETAYVAPGSRKAIRVTWSEKTLPFEEYLSRLLSIGIVGTKDHSQLHPQAPGPANHSASC